ncbi:hypothetical protein CLOACE_01850 [Clostridium acetireducens DSM 10703]|uniref:Uncharacterized protein n=1 Tax=Clostridium acetireducens DSM 10703 TaxID=1121290 RepID=A0A1E8F1R0_9CLOT|nr:hypothetical protein [Clostridium acetireducens]OFI07581.1 hypothetical protein CLOACE_01850 [Clostridium acetireducens DSM 10703]
MFSNTALLQFSKEGAIYGDFKNILSNKINYRHMDKLKNCIQGKKIYITIECEEIYIKIFRIPKVSKNKIKYIISQEVNYYFNYVESIIFDYLIFKEEKEYIDIIVYCLNWNEGKFIKKFIYKCNLKKVSLLQFDILNYYKNHIKCSNYAFVFLHNTDLYFLACNKNKLVCNSININFSSKNYIKNFNDFIDKCNKINYVNTKFEKFYFCNFPYKEYIDYTNSYYNCEDLGEMCNREIILNTIKRRSLWKI